MDMSFYSLMIVTSAAKRYYVFLIIISVINQSTVRSIQSLFWSFSAIAYYPHGVFSPVIELQVFKFEHYTFLKTDIFTAQVDIIITFHQGVPFSGNYCEYLVCFTWTPKWRGAIITVFSFTCARSTIVRLYEKRSI